MNETYQLFKQLEPLSTSTEMDNYHHTVKQELVRQLDESYDIFTYPSFAISYRKDELLQMHADEIVGLSELFQVIFELKQQLTDILSRGLYFDIEQVVSKQHQSQYDFRNLSVVSHLLSLIQKTTRTSHHIYTDIIDPWDLISPKINDWYTVKSIFRTSDLSSLPSKDAIKERLRGKPLHYLSYTKIHDDLDQYVAKHHIRVYRLYHLAQFLLYGGTLFLFGLGLAIIRVFYEPYITYLFDQTFLYLIWVFVVIVFLIGIGWLAILTNKYNYPFPYYRAVSYLFLITIYIQIVVSLHLYEHAWSMIVSSLLFLLAIVSRYGRDYVIADSKYSFLGYFEYGYTTLLALFTVGISIFTSVILVGWYSLLGILVIGLYALITYLGLGKLRNRW